MMMRFNAAPEKAISNHNNAENKPQTTPGEQLPLTKTAIVVNGTVFESAVRGLNCFRAAESGCSRIHEVANQYANTAEPQLAGRLAEELHATTFNIDAAAKGVGELQAFTTASAGAGTAAEDLVVTRDSARIGSAQLKYCGTAGRTTSEIANSKYNGMQRIVPSDQAPRVRSIANRRGIDALGERDYPEVARHATDKLSCDGVESAPLTRDQALDAARDPERVSVRLINGQITRAITAGAATGAVVCGVISAFENTAAWLSGSKPFVVAAFVWVQDTAAGAVSGAVVALAAVGVREMLKRGGAFSLARTAVPVAIAAAGVEIAKDLGRWVDGRIDRPTFFRRARCHALKGTTTYLGARAGAAVGTTIRPGVGTVVVGVFGAILGGIAGQWMSDLLETQLLNITHT